MFDCSVRYENVFKKQEQSSIKEDFARLEGICYLDHTGCPAYSASLIQASLQDLQKNVYGNPHSASLSSKLCNDTIDQIRYKILQHFNTSSKEYSVIFTSGATASLKLVAESFLWSSGESNGGSSEAEDKDKSDFVYMEENHTSILGMREVVSKRGASVICLKHEKTFEVFSQDDNTFSLENECGRNSLFVYSAQCNFSGIKYPLSWIKKVQSGTLSSITNKKSNWFCLLDAATYVSTNKLDLSEVKPDFVAISFYKMFGFPTGLGALLVLNNSSHLLQKIYYGGGTVFMALSEESTFVPRNVLHERFEDGTLNFLSIIALAHGFDFWKKTSCIENISKHCFNLAKYTFTCLSRLHHSNGAPIAVIYSDTLYDDINTQGNILNFNLCRPNGDFIGFSEVLNLANLHRIHLRTGCFCNPGACRRHLQLTNEDVKKHFMSGHVCGDDNDLIDGQPTGSVRISFGPYNTVDDANFFLNFVLNCFVQKPHVQKYPEWWNFKKHQLKNKFATNNLKTSLIKVSSKTVNYLYSSFKNLSIVENSSVCNEERSSEITTGNRSPRNTHLSHIFLYPVKSCGQYSVKHWELCPTGLKYDRTWMITTNSGVALTQKSEPRLCLIKPVINLEKKKLILTFKGFPSFSLDIDNPNAPVTEEAWLCASKVCEDSITGKDCGDSVSSWLSLVLKTNGLRLIKLEERNSKVPGTLSLSNQAQYLLINKTSVDWLSAKLEEQSDCPKESMLYRFRSNFVVSGVQVPFEEQNWKTLTIGNQGFEITGPCGRCQMICIDQETGNKTKEPLTTLAASFKGKLKFGIYLSADENKSTVLSIGDPITFGT